MTRGNSEAYARFAQAQDALACLERALQIIDDLELSGLIGIRIQQAVDALLQEMPTLAGESGQSH